MCDERMQNLVEEGSGLVGMIDEALMKLKILENKRTDSFEPTFILESETQDAIDRMSDDLNRYSCRLDEIYEELLEWSVSRIG